LGELYNVADYPPVEVARKRFQFSWQYTDFGVSPQLENINRELFLREQKKAQEQWVEASGQIQQLLRQSMADLVNHLVTQLSPTADGKRRAFRSSSIENIDKFLEAFDARNITDDKELAQLVEKTRQLTQGLNPEDLRTSDVARETTRNVFEQVKQTLTGMITTKSRLVEFEEEPATV
jgi:hypothetical protein